MLISVLRQIVKLLLSLFDKKAFLQGHRSSIVNHVLLTQSVNALAGTFSKLLGKHV